MVGLIARDDALIAKASVALLMPNGESDESRSHANVAQSATAVVTATILDCMDRSRIWGHADRTTRRGGSPLHFGIINGCVRHRREAQCEPDSRARSQKGS